MKGFIEQLKNIDKAVKVMPRRMGLVAVKFSKDRFVQQAWVDHTTQTWPKRRTSRGSKQRDRGAILVDTGRLKRSIRVISTSSTRVLIGTDVPYAQAHNDGFKGTVKVKQHTRRTFEKNKRGTGVFSVRTRKERTKTVKEETGQLITVGAHSRRINLPERKFIGNSAVLAKQIERAAAAQIQKALK